MGRLLCAAGLIVFAAGWATAQKPATAPANEPRSVRTVRSINSIGPDLKVPLCPSRFHDSLSTNGIAGPDDRNVTRPRVKTTVPALTTEQAIENSGKAHIGNYNVIVSVVVDTKGIPHDLCLQKSSGFGLDASAAAAVAQYRFEPAEKDGKPVKMRVPVEVRFQSPTPTPMGTAAAGEPPK